MTWVIVLVLCVLSGVGFGVIAMAVRPVDSQRAFVAMLCAFALSIWPALMVVTS